MALNEAMAIPAMVAHGGFHSGARGGPGGAGGFVHCFADSGGGFSRQGSLPRGAAANLSG